MYEKQRIKKKGMCVSFSPGNDQAIAIICQITLFFQEREK